MNPFSQHIQSDPRLMEKYERLARAADIFACFIGVVALIGWALAIDLLKSVLPGLATMKVNTALAFVLSGVVVWLLNAKLQPAIDKYRLSVVRVMAMVLTSLALLTLSQDVLNWNVGIDELFFDDTANSSGPFPAGRMSPGTAINFFLLGCCCMLLTLRIRRAGFLAHVLSLMLAMLSILPLIAYAYRVQSLYHVLAYSSMALHTAFTFFVLSSGLLLTRADSSIIAILTSKGIGGETLRRLLPFIIITPILLGWLIRLGEEKTGLYDSEFSLSLVITSGMIVLTIISWVAARSLERIDFERGKSEDALRASEKRFRVMLQSLPNAVVVVDRSGKIELVNARAEEYFGYKDDEITGRPLDILIPTRFKRNHARYFNTYWQNPTPRTMGEDQNLFAKRKNGSEFPVEIGLTPTQIDGTTFILSSIIDITERKTIEQEREHLLNTIKEKNSELEQIVYVTSHDLRAPLVNIQGFSRELTESCNKLAVKLGNGQVPVKLRQEVTEVLQADIPESLQIISESTNRMDSLLNGLLKLSRLGRTTVTIQKLDMNKLISQVAKIFEFQMKERRATLVLESCPPCYGDPTQINQVFSNLIGHALKYLHPDRVGEIRVPLQHPRRLWP